MNFEFNLNLVQSIWFSLNLGRNKAKNIIMSIALVQYIIIPIFSNINEQTTCGISFLYLKFPDKKGLHKVKSNHINFG